jgi:hypothetical protein
MATSKDILRDQLRNRLRNQLNTFPNVLLYDTGMDPKSIEVMDHWYPHPVFHEDSTRPLGHYRTQFVMCLHTATKEGRIYYRTVS